MTRNLVTGATGFIGHHLVKLLTDQGEQTTCLVRPTSQCDQLQRFNPQLVHGDVTDRDSVRRALAGVDVVYHLAGLTKSLRCDELQRVNEEGVRNVAACCAELDRPPVLVVVSSLAAAGPAPGDRALDETDEPAPVSQYGRSKRAGELAAAEFASRVPTTIVRPPIVLGEGDRAGFPMFESVAKWGIHLVPTFFDHRFSIVHAQDLATALVLLASQGHRISGDEGDAEGIYYAAADETPTYAELGRMIGDVFGRSHVLVLHNPKAAVWSIAAISEFVSRIRRKPHFLNLDKAREATAGSWACRCDHLRRDTGFQPAQSLQQRLSQTAQWYIGQGWLPQA